MNLAGPRTRFAVLAIAVLTLASAAPAAAGQIVLQNDDLVDFGTAAIQSGFVAGEHGAAWLTSSCNGDVVAIQILWLSFFGGAPDTLGEAVRVSEAGTFPTPGPVIQELLGPLMQDGGLNEFTLVPPIPISDGETIVASFIFLSSPPMLGPSLVTDISGCQAGRNGVFAIPGGWLNLCDFGVSGDLVIRAVVDCLDPLVFADGFESGDTSAWSSTVP